MLQTGRLHIRALLPGDLKLYLSGNDLYETAQQLNAVGRTVPDTILAMMHNGTLPGMETCSPSDYIFHTLWIAIDRATRTIIGEFQLKGKPAGNGWVEIGYETFADFRRKGYMLEIIQAFCAWAPQHGINGFIAETLSYNTASIELLKKTGFKPVKQQQQIIIWKKKL